ncbi:uncharacterized protein C2845_PM14G18320 [Panicum miliaceum]|uniref:DM2 domain-containing protein n=1 Tax=Panicum miliaceum TaxID=4540 RepID=A0A3L6PMI8_PANMI|nr:uncharacterized protein C2845_PM14G18320 [Panicum miliaceum]
MLSDQELAHCVESLVRQTAARGGAGISADSVVRQLGAQLGVDVSPKAPLIRSVLVALLGPAAAAPDPAAAARKDPFDPAAGGGARAEAPAQQLPFSTSAAAAASSASAPPPAPAVPHFFPQQMQSYLSASQQYQHQQHRPGAPASPFDVAASYRYGHQPFPQGDQAQLQRLVQLQQHHQQQQMAAAAAPASAAAATPGESPRAAAAAAPAGSKKDSSASAGAKRRGGPGGLNKVCGVSPELQAIVGEPAMARTEIVKQLWAYIRKNNLQDPNNKRKIICNDELRLVFETDSTDMFKMNKLLSKHIRPLETTNDSKRESKKMKPEGGEPISPVETDVKQLSFVVSDALAAFFGTGEREMPHSEAVKRVWDHIKSNNLEDPENPTVILCDSKLKELFGCESLTAHGVSELVSDHLFKQPAKI